MILIAIIIKGDVVDYDNDYGYVGVNDDGFKVVDYFVMDDGRL